MEPLRDPTYILSEGGVQWSLVFSLLLLAFGLVLLFIVLYMNKRKEGVFFGSVKGEKYGITKYLKDAKDEVAYFNKTNMMCAIYPENYQIPPKKEPSKLELWWKGLFKKTDETVAQENAVESTEPSETAETVENEETVKTPETDE